MQGALWTGGCPREKGFAEGQPILFMLVHFEIVRLSCETGRRASCREREGRVRGGPE